MDIQAKKLDLIKWIVELDDPKVIQQLFVLQHQILQHDSAGDWDLLSDYQKQHILIALEEADADEGIPAKEFIQRSREKIAKQHN
jgi:hypothetical protein